MTDVLPEDATVEIYRRQPDGWCAIRPPENSFSWVYAQHVQAVGQRVARINKDDAPARVGSRLSARRNVVQVRLRKGEVVKIVGNDDRKGEPWYKIAPPAGEFRWMHANDLAPLGRDRFTSEPATPIATVSLEQPADDQAGDVAEELPAPPLSSASAVSAVTNGTDTATAVSSPSTEITPIETKAPSAPSASSPDVASELGGLELRLSRMVAEPTATWNVEPLEQAAERLLSQADTVADRNAVKGTLAKIDRFAAIQRRHRAIHGGTYYGNAFNTAVAGNGRLQPRPPIAGNGQTAAASENADDALSGRFDAVGMLRPVVSRRPGAPQFALVNSQGQVVSFLTPTPDINLQPYVGQWIGVVGSRGYIPEFRRAHVTAGRVTPLDGRVLR